MHKSARLTVIVCGIAALVLGAGCARKYQKVEDSYSKPINCSTAWADIQWLQSNKVSKSEEAAQGAKFALPTTIIVGAITGTAGAQSDVATGQFNRKIDERIGDNKETCNLR